MPAVFFPRIVILTNQNLKLLRALDVKHSLSIWQFTIPLYELFANTLVLSLCGLVGFVHSFNGTFSVLYMCMCVVLCFSERDQVITVSKDRNLRIYDVHDHSCTLNFQLKNFSLISSICFNPKHKVRHANTKGLTNSLKTHQSGHGINSNKI